MSAPENSLGEISHKLKSPITGIQMALMLLLEEAVGPLTDKQRKLLDSAKEECDRLVSNIDEILLDQFDA